MIVSDQFGTCLHGASLVRINPGPNTPSHPVSGFGNLDLVPLLRQHAPGHEARESGADHNHLAAAHRRRRSPSNPRAKAFQMRLDAALNLAASLGGRSDRIKTPVEASIQ